MYLLWGIHFTNVSQEQCVVVCHETLRERTNTCLCTPVQSLPSIHTEKSSANHLAATQWIHPRRGGEEASGRRLHAQPSQRAVEKSHRCFLGSYSSGCHVWCSLVISAMTLKILPMPFFIASLFHFAGPSQVTLGYYCLSQWRCCNVIPALIAEMSPMTMHIRLAPLTSSVSVQTDCFSSVEGRHCAKWHILFASWVSYLLSFYFFIFTLTFHWHCNFSQYLLIFLKFFFFLFLVEKYKLGYRCCCFSFCHIGDEYDNNCQVLTFVFCFFPLFQFGPCWVLFRCLFTLLQFPT